MMPSHFVGTPSPTHPSQTIQTHLVWSPITTHMAVTSLENVLLWWRKAIEAKTLLVKGPLGPTPVPQFHVCAKQGMDDHSDLTLPVGGSLNH